MKCNKCGTPIIPGENTCRICGNTNFSERSKEPEVIDFLDEIDEKVEIEEEKINELPDLIDIIDIEPVKGNVNLVEKKEEILKGNNTLQQMSELVFEEKKLEPIEATVKDETTQLQVETKQELKPEKVSKKEKAKKAVEEEPKTKKKKVLDKANEKEEKNKKVEKIKTEKKANGVVTVLFTILLLCSMGLNIFLFINKGDSKSVSGETTKTETTYSKVSYSNYKVTIPSVWITENKNNSLLIYDDTQNWSASMKLVDDADYEAFVTNRETLSESLKSSKYQFTSNYSKSVNEKDFYLFKGKYYDYSVFVIATELDENTLVVVDLKFKGEVDDILLNNILTSMSNIKENNTEELFKDNFEFVDITEQIKSVSKKNETTKE